MAIITLTSDLGLSDYYVAAVKGAIFKQLPQAQIIDISNQIQKFNIVEGAFVLSQAYKNFPDGTIHIVSIKPEVNANTDHVVMEYDGHFFVGADNGLFSLIIQAPPTRVVTLSLNDPEGLTFPTKSVFVTAACHLARGGKMELLGPNHGHIREFTRLVPRTNEDLISGNVQHIDSYGNIITNITRQTFHQTGRNRAFEISFRRRNYSIKRISSTYGEVPDGELQALFGESGFLEISLHNLSATKLLGMHLGDVVTIEFFS